VVIVAGEEVFVFGHLFEEAHFGGADFVFGGAGDFVAGVVGEDVGAGFGKVEGHPDAAGAYLA